MTQIFQVVVNGTNITYQVESVNISLAVGRIVNTATVTVPFDPTRYLGERIEITHGDHVFKGIIRDYTKQSQLLYSMTCASLGAKLGEPFFVDVEGLAYATNASDLCAEYASEAGIPITYTAVPLDFGGSWVESGTPEDSLMRMGAVIGADIYDNGTGLVIENPKPIKDPGRELNDDDLLQTPIISDTIVDNGLGFVTTKTSNAYADDGGDIIARNKIAADVNTKTGRVKIYTMPNEPLDTWYGMHKVGEGNEYLTLSKGLANSTFVETDGVVFDVRRVTLNGVDISNYNYVAGTSIIFFTTPQNGNLKVEYKTHYREFRLHTQLTPEGVFYYFNCTKGNEYLDDRGLLDESKTTEPSFSAGEGSDAWGYEVPDGTDYVKGFYFYTWGDPAIAFYSGARQISYAEKIYCSPGIFTKYVKAVLSEDGSGFKAAVDTQANTVVSVTSAGTEIPYTQETDAEGYNYIRTNIYYPDVEIEYTYTGHKCFVQYARNMEGLKQTIVLNESAEIELITAGEWWDPANVPCGYPTEYPFNIPELIKGIGIEDCVGKTIGGMMAPIDSKGFCYALITQDGIYEYDAGVVKPGTIIRLRANSNGSLSDDL